MNVLFNLNENQATFNFNDAFEFEHFATLHFKIMERFTELYQKGANLSDDYEDRHIVALKLFKLGQSIIQVVDSKGLCLHDKTLRNLALAATQGEYMAFYEHLATLPTDKDLIDLLINAPCSFNVPLSYTNKQGFITSYPCNDKVIVLDIDNLQAGMFNAYNMPTIEVKETGGIDNTEYTEHTEHVLTDEAFKTWAQMNALWFNDQYACVYESTLLTK